MSSLQKLAWLKLGSLRVQQQGDEALFNALEDLSLRMG